MSALDNLDRLLSAANASDGTSSRTFTYDDAGNTLTVAVLDRLAGALGIHVSTLLLKLLTGHERPPPLRGGRKPRERSGFP